MSKKRGLGKGLGALIPSVDNSEPVDMEKDNNSDIYKLIPVNAIFPNPRQPRCDFNLEKLEELKKSISEHGVVQPIVVRPLPNENYELIAGERRWRACKKLALEQIPAIIKTYNDIDAAAVTLIENIQREDLNSLEEALAYKKLMDTYGLTQEEVAGRVGKSRSLVANLLRLLSLPGEIKEMLINNIISTGHAKALLALDDPDMQIQVAEKITSDILSVRETEKLIKDILSGKEPKQKNKIEKDKFFIDMEQSLNNYFQTAVKININKKGQGKIEIAYNSRDDLTRIINMLNNETDSN